MCLLVALSSLAAGCKPQSPKEVMWEAVRAIKKDNFAKFRSLWTKDSRKEWDEMTKDDDAKSRLLNEIRANAKDYELGKETINGDSATVEVTYRKSGFKEKSTEHFRVEDGEWKLAFRSGLPKAPE